MSKSVWMSARSSRPFESGFVCAPRYGEMCAASSAGRASQPVMQHLPPYTRDVLGSDLLHAPPQTFGGLRVLDGDDGRLADGREAGPAQHSLPVRCERWVHLGDAGQRDQPLVALLRVVRPGHVVGGYDGPRVVRRDRVCHEATAPRHPEEQVITTPDAVVLFRSPDIVVLADLPVPGATGVDTDDPTRHTSVPFSDRSLRVEACPESEACRAAAIRISGTDEMACSDEVAQGVAGRGVGGVEDGADHAAREEDLVRVAHQAVELGVAHRRTVSEGRILVRRPHGHEPPVAPYEIRPEDHPAPVVLEALRGGHAPHLVEPRRIARPQRGRRSPADPSLTLEVPRPSPRADPPIRHQRSVDPWIAPRPAVPGRDPRPVVTGGSPGSTNRVVRVG